MTGPGRPPLRVPGRSPRRLPGRPGRAGLRRTSGRLAQRSLSLARRGPARWASATGRAAAVGVPTAAVAAYVAFETARIRRVPRLPEAARDLDLVVDAHRGGPTASILMIGDSVASGVGASAPERSLPVELARLVTADLDRPVHVRSLGRTGARAETVRAEQTPRFAEVGAVDVVVASLGANDATHLTPPDRFTADLRSVCEQARAATGAPILLTGVPEFRGARALGLPLRTLAWLAGQVLHERQRRLAEELDGVLFADVLARAGPEFRRDRDLVAYDGYHPSDRGAARLAEGMAPAVTAALRTGRAGDLSA